MTLQTKHRAGATGWVVRPPQPGELPACRALLPEAFPAVGRAAELWVAATPAGVAGAAAVAWVPGGFPVAVHVAAPWRRQGLGRALLDAAVAGVAGETPVVRAWRDVDEGSPAAALLRGAGFACVRRFLMFQTDGVALEAILSGLLRRAAGRVPPDVQLAPLADMPAAAAAVAELVAARFGAWRHDVAGRLRPGAPGGYDLRHSLVLLQGGAVAGALLCRVADGVLEVDVNAVAPGYGHGWANLLLLEGVTRRGREAGFASCRFGCEPHVRDTLNVARRCGAAPAPDRLAMARKI